MQLRKHVASMASGARLISTQVVLRRDLEDYAAPYAACAALALLAAALARGMLPVVRGRRLTPTPPPPVARARDTLSLLACA